MQSITGKLDTSKGTKGKCQPTLMSSFEHLAFQMQADKLTGFSSSVGRRGFIACIPVNKMQFESTGHMPRFIKGQDYQPLLIRCRMPMYVCTQCGFSSEKGEEKIHRICYTWETTSIQQGSKMEST